MSKELKAALCPFLSRVHQRLSALRRISTTPKGVTRLAFSSEVERARRLILAPFAKDRRFRIRFDPADNAFVTYPAEGPTRGGLMVGSHLDSVIEGGAYDGALGVVYGVTLLEVAASLKGEQVGPLHLAIFNDEEGVRFGNGLFGSRALVGKTRPEELDLVDREGNRLRDLVRHTRLKGRGLLGYAPPVRPAYFVEPHIEQGARLEEAGARVGIVEGIVGIRRFRLEAIGEAGHAGTVGMDDRKDALVAASRVIVSLPDCVRGIEGAVITAGSIFCQPNAHNTIPGRALVTIEFRAKRRELQESIQRRLTRLVRTVQGRFPGKLTLTPIRDSTPVPMSREIQRAMRNTARDLSLRSISLFSMAGHDAMNVASLTRAGMFFVPSVDGKSHRPDEFTSREDIEAGFLFLVRLAQSLSFLPALKV